MCRCRLWHGFGEDFWIHACDNWWIRLRAKAVACEATYTYIFSRSLKGALSRRLESFRRIDAMLYDEAVVEDTLSRCGSSDDSCRSP